MTSIDGEGTSNGETVTSAAPEPPRERAPEPPPSTARPTRAPARLFTRARGAVLTALTLLFFVALFAGRIAEPALLGWRSGLERWIARSDGSAALLGQLAVVAGSLMAIQLLIATLVESNLNVAFRLVAAPTTAGVVTLVMASATRELPVLLVLGLASLASFMALFAAVPAIAGEHSRAAGLVIGIAGLTSLSSVLGRALAIWASQEALTHLFRVAQTLATFTFVLDLVSLGVAIAWLSARRPRASLLVWIPTVLLGAALALVSLYTTPAPESVLGLVTKGVNAFMRHPYPFVPGVLHFFLTLTLFLAVPATLLCRGDRPYARAAIALALLAKSGTDIPVLALSLLLASLLAGISRARELDGSPPPSAPEPVAQ